MTTIQVYDKFVDDQRLLKPRSCPWADYITRIFSESANTQGLKSERDYYFNLYKELTQTIEKYVHLIKRLSDIQSEELHCILDPIISSNGDVHIARYDVTTKPVINFTWR